MFALHLLRGDGNFAGITQVWRYLSNSTVDRVADPPRSRYAVAEVIDVFTIDKQAFGAFVAQLRREKGLTQKELARELYVSDKAVSKWETGASIPDTALLVPLAELLGVTVTELLLCRRQVDQAPMDARTVEDVVENRHCVLR